MNVRVLEAFSGWLLPAPAHFSSDCGLVLLFVFVFMAEKEQEPTRSTSWAGISIRNRDWSCCTPRTPRLDAACRACCCAVASRLSFCEAVAVLR